MRGGGAALRKCERPVKPAGINVGGRKIDGQWKYRQDPETQEQLDIHVLTTDRKW